MPLTRRIVKANPRTQQVLQTEEVQALIQQKIESGVNEELAESLVLTELKQEDPDLGKGLTIDEAEALFSGFPFKSVEEEESGDVWVTFRWKDVAEGLWRSSLALRPAHRSRQSLDRLLSRRVTSLRLHIRSRTRPRRRRTRPTH